MPNPLKLLKTQEAINQEKVDTFCEALQDEINKLNGTKVNRDIFIEFLYLNRKFFADDTLNNLLVEKNLDIPENKKVELFFIKKKLQRIYFLAELAKSHPVYLHKIAMTQLEVNYFSALLPT